MTFDIQTIPDRYIYRRLLDHKDSFLFYEVSDLVRSDQSLKTAEGV